MAVKNIPYGITDFERIRLNGYYSVSLYLLICFPGTMI